MALAKQDATSGLVLRLNVLANLCERFAFAPLPPTPPETAAPPVIARPALGPSDPPPGAAATAAASVEAAVGAPSGGYFVNHYVDLGLARPLARHYNCASKTGQTKGEAMAESYQRCFVRGTWVCG